jgi:microcin C transport system substrate-binding protein
MNSKMAYLAIQRLNQSASRLPVARLICRSHIGGKQSADGIPYGGGRRSRHHDRRNFALRRRVKTAILIVIVCVVGATHFRGVIADTLARLHGLSKYGDLKYAPEFTHFSYVKPNAPKGGRIRLAATGTFDKLNPYSLKGIAAAGSSLPFDTLMESSADEPQSIYGLIAESVEIPPNRSWIVFNLRPKARFHDGSQITAHDVAFTFDIIKKDGHPRYRLALKNVVSVEKLGTHRVKFTFGAGASKELPLLVGQLPVLSRAYWKGRDFTKAGLDAPLGSGPYRVDNVDPGRSVSYRRVKNYWAANLPIKRGRHNFDVIQYDYYRDRTVALEAFKAGEYDLRQEFVSKFWATAYDSPAVTDGLIRKKLFRHNRPTGMQALVFNTRRPLFSDRRVRHAVSHAFDFEWTNEALFYKVYRRTRSYFANSVFAAEKTPAAEELAVLEPFRGRVPEEIFTNVYRPPTTKRDEGVRGNLIRGLEIMKDAGWVVRDGVLVNEKTGRPFEFEILLNNPSFERIVEPFVRNLKRMGIEARMRVVDSSQYQNRRKSFAYDMTLVVWRQSLSPGNEQRNLWKSAAADVNGSQNFAGVKDPVVDELVEQALIAKDRKSLIAHIRALDRVLLWGHYVIPNWYSRADRVAYWDRFAWPKVTPARGYQLDSWWVDPDKAARIDQGLAAVAGETKRKLKANDPWWQSRSLWVFAIVVSAVGFVVMRSRRKV